MNGLKIEFKKIGSYTYANIIHINTGLFVYKSSTPLTGSQKAFKQMVDQFLSDVDWCFSEEDAKNINFMRDKVDAVTKFRLAVEKGIRFNY